MLIFEHVLKSISHRSNPTFSQHGIYIVFTQCLGQSQFISNNIFFSCCDNAIFGQYDQTSTSRSLHIIVRNKKIYFGFYNDDTQGNIVLSTNIWYHVSKLILKDVESGTTFYFR